MILYESERSIETGYIYEQNDLCLSFQKHAHYSFEVICVNDGAINCEVDNISFKLKKNDVLLIFPGQIHSYTTCKYSKSYLCVFSNDLVSEFYNEVNGKKLKNPVINIDKLDEFIEEFKEGNIFIKKAILYKLCGILYRQSPLYNIETSNYHLASQIALYVQNNYTKEITLKTIALKCGYSYSYLSYFFNHQFKMNFSQYVNIFRLQYAAQLLSTSHKSITEIAYESGFGTIRNFNNAFKSYYKISLKDYRSNTNI